MPLAAMPTGIVKAWKPDKGFGFLCADDGSQDVFAHVKQLNGDQESMKQRGHEGRRVTYEFEMDTARGKPKALSWAFLDAPPVALAAPQVVASPQVIAAPQVVTAPGGASNATVQAILQAAGLSAAQPVPQAPAGGQHIIGNLQGLVVRGTAAPAVVQPPPPQPMIAQYQQYPTQYAAPPPPPQHVPIQIPPRATPPPPPPPVPQALEEVEIPEHVVSDLLKADPYLEQIKQQAGGDISLEVSPATTTGGRRMVRIWGPAVSASLGACLLFQKAAEAA